MPPASVPGPALRLVVAVLTFRRRDELARLLPEALAEMDAAEHEIGLASSLVVVDNDPERSASEVVEAVDDPRVRYAPEARPGISAARNRALDEAMDDDVLVYIDDDERPHRGWLTSLVRTWQQHRAGAVTGPVVTEYLGEPDPFVVAGGFFERAHRAGLVTGTRVSRAATNNLLLDLRRLPNGLRFDEDFGRSGGEDGLFTGHLTAAGVPIVWCAEAVVSDRAPADRLTRAYVLRRTRGLACTSVLAEVRLQRGPLGRARLRVTTAAKETVRAAAGVTQAGVGVVTGSLERRARGLRALARARGAWAGVLGRFPLTYG